ncbi:MAG: division/cell wall cluster transcriptional repressor MraZ [Phycisphaerae bacterium]
MEQNSNEFPDVLIGDHELTIDEKNRLLVPSEIRRQLDPTQSGITLILTVGNNGRAWLYPEGWYRAIVSKRSRDIEPGFQEQAFNLAHFARSTRLNWDKQGRILLPEKTLRRTGLEREVTLLCVGDHMEIWNRDTWDRFDELLMSGATYEEAAAKLAAGRGPRA